MLAIKIIFLTLLTSQISTNLEQLANYIKHSGTSDSTYTYLSDRVFFKMKSNECFARSILEVCTIRDAKQSDLAWRRLRQISLKGISVEHLSLGVDALLLRYKQTKNLPFLSQAVNIPLDGGYADGQELSITKIILKVEDAHATPRAGVLKAIATIKKDGMPEFWDEVVDFLKKQPKSKLVLALVKAWQAR
jgi:hypothetical protein